MNKENHRDNYHHMNTRLVFLLSVFAIEFAFAETSYSPYVNHTYPVNVYWGDTHLHSNLSTDASMFGNKILGPEEAYRFAKGEEVIANNGMTARLSRPLDFIVLADHAFNLGLLAGIASADPVFLDTPLGKKLYQQWLKIQTNLNSVVRSEETLKFVIDNFFQEKPIKEDVYRKSVWQQITANADRHNEPGKFTAFIGYEWTSQWTPVGESNGNIHRVVIFKDGANKTNQILPFSMYDSKNPEDLWKYFENYHQTTGGDVLAIPHNGNLSEGQMFSLVDHRGQPLSQSYAETRSRWEPLYEVTQIKGDSETHLILSPTDEFSDYETWDSWSDTWNNWSDRSLKDFKNPSLIERKKSEYARPALKLGLNQQARIGVNPFKFGLIGSTDAHTSLATADENNFWGKVSDMEPSSERMLAPSLFKMSRWGYAANGYAAVWAEENTRESLFAAMKRRETYATKGPRMTVRFFGGWDYRSDDALKRDLARTGYQKGVPMGGDLTAAPKGKSPNFLISAVKDPDGANLDRVQVIKGWRDKAGELHEKVYDVALSDNRKPNHAGKVKPVGNTVNIADASYTNSIGEPELVVVWQDPDFDKDELAFYYVRVLEIPTPRWTAYDAKFFKLNDIPDEVPMIIQERAYTSSIWYSP